MRVSRCKSETCRASIVWCETEKGKRMPVDEEPVPADSTKVQFYLEEIDGATGGERDMPCAIFAPVFQRFSTRRELFVSHWGTCPDAQSFRRGK